MCCYFLSFIEGNKNMTKLPPALCPHLMHSLRASQIYQTVMIFNISGYLGQNF